MNTTQSDKALQFQKLHEKEGIFLIPNPWDAGSARILAGLGFEAFATSSSACAAVLGRRDHRVTRAEALEHVRAIASATARPVSADLENGFGDDPATVAETIRRVADAGAAGGSIEDAPPDGGFLPRASGFLLQTDADERRSARLVAQRDAQITLLSASIRVHLRLTAFGKEENMNNEIIIVIAVAAAVAVAVIAAAKFPKIRHAFLAPEGYAGLLYHKGKFVKVLGAGRHIRWGCHYTLDAQDLRKASLLVAGQDVLTGDSVGLKLSLLVTYQVTDPVKAAHETQNWQGDLYNAAQLAMRAVVGGIAVEALLNQRLQIGAQLLARVQPEAAKLGINVHAVELNDVMFPADLKRAFGDVLKAKQEGQAALERARGESAALRNLANAARVLEGNPGLMNLRLMQSLTAAQNAGNTLVVGMPGGFVPLNQAMPAPNSEAGEVKGPGDAET